MDPQKHLEKHLTNLPCPVCERFRFYSDLTLRRHLERFHRRDDVMELILLSKGMAGITPEAVRQ